MRTAILDRRCLAGVLIAAGIAAGLAWTAAPAGAQTAGAQTSDPPNEPQPPGASTSPGLTHPRAIDDEDLKRFAAATAKIRIIDREYTKKKDGAPAGESEALSAAEEREKLAAVQAAGLNAELYNAISKAIQDDPALAEKAYGYIHAAPVK